VIVSDILYYRWTQWLFNELFKADLAYQKEAEVNFCPSCKTVVADEQVIDGKCERCQSKVERKILKQWFFRITDYADRLLDGHKKIDWSQRVITAQRNWIGKKEGAEITFKIKGVKKEILVFTTRPDTLYGATFLVVAPEYAKENLIKVIPQGQRKVVEEYIQKAFLKGTEETEKEKTGVDTSLVAVNPVNSKEIPIWVSSYVLAGYGSGAIMGVPAHDERDWEFAKKFSLPIVEVIEGGDVEKEAYTGEGKIVNSGEWNARVYPEDYLWILSDIEKRGWGKRAVNYHLRDWLISRQRYWGPPIPLIYCEDCDQKGEGYVVNNQKLLHKDQKDWNPAGWWPDENLPVELPKLSDWKPEGTGKGPLAAHPEFYKTKCPHCGSNAVRETDVSDTFLDSSWY
jgi:leucyl-tRNA synthetase